MENEKTKTSRANQTGQKLKDQKFGFHHLL